MQLYTWPGLYLEEVHTVAQKELPTAVPVFVGYVRRSDARPSSLKHWVQFAMRFGDPLEHGYLAYAVRGFFENGGKLCYVVPLQASKNPLEALRTALADSRGMEDADLLCVPDLMLAPSGQKLDQQATAHLQATLLHPGPYGGEPLRFVILDSLPDADPAAERKHCAGLLQAAHQLGATPAEFAGAALYYPWVAVPRFVPTREQAVVGEKVDTIFVPPCGHVAGIYSRTDEGAGIRKAPANEALHGVLDLQTRLRDGDQGALFTQSELGDEAPIPPGAVNCLRAFPGRGIRIWGARTLSNDAAWRYVNVRRLFLNAIRWIEHKMARMAFQPNNPDLWARIRRELNAYCFELFRRGALKGDTTAEAFYVHCDESLNPPEVCDSGTVVAEVGLAAARPHEFIVIRLVHRDSGITTTGGSADSL